MLSNYQGNYSDVFKHYQELKTYLEKIEFNDNKELSSLRDKMFNLPLSESVQDVEEMLNNLRDLTLLLKSNGTQNLQNYVKELEQGKTIQTNYVMIDGRLTQLNKLLEFTPEVILANLNDVIYLNEVEKLHAFLDHNKELIDKLNCYGKVINQGLIFACSKGSTNIIKELIKNPLIDMKYVDSKQSGALFRVCSEQYQYDNPKEILDTFDLLVKKTREQDRLKEALTSHGNYKSILYHVVVDTEDLDLAEQLISRLDILCKEAEIDLFKYKDNPLLSAAKNFKEPEKQKIILQCLVNMMQDISTIETKSSILKEALNYCAKYDNVEQAKIIICTAQDPIKELIEYGQNDILYGTMQVAINNYHSDFYTGITGCAYSLGLIGDDSISDTEE